MTVFSPFSDDVISQRPNVWVRVVRWNNDCRHVDGGVHLWFETAQPRRWWRDCASRTAAAIVNAAGGIAVDYQGVVHVVVPGHYGMVSYRWMSAAAEAAECPLSEDSRRRIEAALVGAGQASLRADGGALLLSPPDPYMAPTYLRPGVLLPRPTYRDWTPAEVSPALDDAMLRVIHAAWNVVATTSPHDGYTATLAIRSADALSSRPLDVQATAAEYLGMLLRNELDELAAQWLIERGCPDELHRYVRTPAEPVFAE